MSDPTRIYKSTLHASTITNLAADRANIAKLRANVAEIDVLTVNTSISLPDGSLLINSSGAGTVLTTQPNGGVLTNDAFSLKTLTSTGGTVAITTSNTEVNFEVGAAGVTTLANAGGTTIITDGTGPSLEIKGQGTSPLLALSNTATTFGFDNVQIRLRDTAGSQPPTVGPASATGTPSVAIGDSAAATAANTVSVGISSTASTANSIAVGVNANAAGGGGEIAIGANAGTAGAGNAVAIGNAANASVSGGVALGNGTAASAADAIAIGNGSLALVANAVALGNTASASAGAASAIGNTASASGTNSIAFGSGTSAVAASSVALGANADVDATQPAGVAIGLNAAVSGAVGTGEAIAIGDTVVISADRSAFVGQHVTCSAADAGGFAFGGAGANTITQSEGGFLAARRNAGQVSYAFLGQTISYLNGFLFHEWADPVVTAANPYSPTILTLIGRNTNMTTGGATLVMPDPGTVSALSSSWGRDAGGTVLLPSSRGVFFCITNTSGGPITINYASVVGGSYDVIDSSGTVYAPPSKTISDGNIHYFCLKSKGTPGDYRIEKIGSFNNTLWV